jgi:hypothetical protein
MLADPAPGPLLFVLELERLATDSRQAANATFVLATLVQMHEQVRRRRRNTAQRLRDSGVPQPRGRGCRVNVAGGALDLSVLGLPFGSSRSDKQMVRVAQIVGASANLRDLLGVAECDDPGGSNANVPRSPSSRRSMGW